jgi:uncharacterized membrane protein YdjX (TVP38/TMEM64 family)
MFNEISLFLSSQPWIAWVMDLMQSHGVLAGIGIPILEAFFPIFPLTAIVALNVHLYGILAGAIFSWVGNMVGSYLLFAAILKWKRKKETEKMKKIHQWMEAKGWMGLLILYAMPFMPSILLTSSAAWFNLSRRHFIYALLGGKILLMVFLTMIGTQIGAIFENPVRSILILAIIVLAMVGMKRWTEKNVGLTTT